MSLDFLSRALLGNVEKYLAAARGPYEDDIKARLKAIDSIWALGEIGDPKLMSKLSEFYSESDDVLRVNLIISMGKISKGDGKAGPFLLKVAASTEETEPVRAVAFEMLEKIGYPSSITNLARSRHTGIEKGDIVYTGGMLGSMAGWVSPDLPVGHSGLFLGTEVNNGRINILVTDCIPNYFTPGGVRNIRSWYHFTHHFFYPYYGNRTTPVKPTPVQRKQLVDLGYKLGGLGLRYNNTHLTQKGPVSFDCVGYTEYIYEQVGLNPTDNSYETGAGWPLTPWEQFIALKPNFPGRPEPTYPLTNVVTHPHQGLITGDFIYLPADFTIKSVQVPEVNTDIRPAPAD
ncbi:MAG TPA: hypothetical protein DCS63_05940 [Elusimicrobia bacterium]|nr:hypothetical protein [Elusimicrobiota bacterium]